MSKKVKARVSIRDYLEEIYPRSATKKEILQETRIKECTCDGALRTLRSRGFIELIGKKGNANIYRFKSSWLNT